MWIDTALNQRSVAYIRDPMRGGSTLFLISHVNFSIFIKFKIMVLYNRSSILKSFKILLKHFD